MTVPHLIESLLGITITTDDLDALRSNPEGYVVSPSDAQKLKDLFSLLDRFEELEVRIDGQH